VTQVALVEVVWILGRAYDATRGEIAEVIEALLRTKELVLEEMKTVSKALRVFSSSAADFPDCLIERACHDADCEYTATFDTKAAKSAPLKLIK
jgi:predicted nucleic-acid-binding protein